jgi:hypothetical protein
MKRRPSTGLLLSQPQVPRSEQRPLVEQTHAELEVATAERDAIVHQGHL